MPLLAAACQIGRASERLLERFGGVDHRGHRDRFPLAEGAALGRHSELGPSRATALAAAAGAVQRGGVPFGTGAAGGFALGEDFGRGGRESGGREICSRETESR